MKYFIIFFSLFVALFLEASLFSLPFLLLCLIFFGVFYKESWIFPVAFLFGIVLDMLLFRTVGVTSLFFLCVLGVVFLYQRKFETQSIPFLLCFSWGVTYVYGLLFHEQHVLLQAISGAALEGGVFYLLSLYNTKPLRRSYR